MHQLDTLATYDNERIGSEFSNSAASLLDERRRHQSRCSELLVESFKGSLSDSTSLPKLALSQTCQFETQQARLESITTWVVTIVLAALAGTICALVIKHLQM